jgi:hypothetical protein
VRLGGGEEPGDGGKTSSQEEWVSVGRAKSVRGIARNEVP